MRLLQDEIKICKQQNGFMPGKSTTEERTKRTVFCVCKLREGIRQLVPREEFLDSLRTSSISEVYVKVIQKCMMAVQMESRLLLKHQKNLVQGWISPRIRLSPFLFAIVMKRLADGIRETSPWNIMFADGIALYNESRETATANLEKWKYASKK